MHPIIDGLKDKDPHDLVTPETWFPNGNAERGFIWSLFINAVNKQSHQTITIDIHQINDQIICLNLLYV